MEQIIKPTIDFIQSIGFIGILIILAVPKLRKIVFGDNGNAYQGQIDELKKHAQVANDEMGKIQQDIEVIKNDIAWIKGKLDK